MPGDALDIDFPEVSQDPGFSFRLGRGMDLMTPIELVADSDHSTGDGREPPCR